MGKDIKVWVFDDLAGKDTEATHTDVPLAFGSWAGTIDLGGVNYKRLEDFLAPFMKAGKREGHANPGQRRGRKPNWYFQGLREYAAERGITLEKGADGKTSYPAALRRDYEAHLAARQEGT